MTAGVVLNTMSVSRRGTGVRSTVDALASQIHPVFMLPPVAVSVFGSVLAGEFALPLAALHATAIFFAVYTAHVKDGYVDFHVRDEDDDHPLTVFGCRLALAGASVGFFGCLFILWAVVGPGAVLITLPCWLIAYHHAPQLDMNPITATTGYPLGIALALVGGYYVQTQTLAAVPLAFAAVFLLLLSGIKTIDDAKDYEYDRSISKRTVAVVLGRERARTAAFGLMVSALLLVVGLAASDVFPPGSAVAALAFAAVAAVASRTTDPSLATMLLIRGSYVFLALLVVAVWFRPLG